MPITQSNPNYELIRSLLQSAVINGRRLDRVEIQNNLPILDNIIFDLPNGNTVTINTTDDENFSVIINRQEPDYNTQKFSGTLATDMLQQLPKEFKSVEFRKEMHGTNLKVLYKMPALQARQTASTKAFSSAQADRASFDSAPIASRTASASAFAMAFDRNITNSLNDKIRFDAWKNEIAAREVFLGDSRYNDEYVEREIGLLYLLNPTNRNTGEVIELINQTAEKLKRLSQNINNSKQTKSIDLLLKMMNEANLKDGSQINIADFNNRITNLYSNTIFIELLDSVRQGLEMRDSGERNDDRILDRIVTNLFNSHPHFIAGFQTSSFEAARHAFLAANAIMQKERLQMEEEKRLREKENPRRRHVSFGDQATHQERFPPHQRATLATAPSAILPEYEDYDAELDEIFSRRHSEPILAYKNPTPPVNFGAAVGDELEEEIRATSAINNSDKKSRASSHWMQNQLSGLSLGLRKERSFYNEYSESSPNASKVEKPQSPTAEENEKKKQEKKK